MKTFNFVVLIAAMGLLAGCVTPETTKPATASADFHQFHNVKLTVTDVAKTAYAKEGLPLFEGLLKGQLQSLGYNLVTAEPELVMDVAVQQFDPGNRTLRTLVGFGAGRAVMTYTARFKDPTGNLFAELHGGKVYHGLELDDNPTFKSDEATRMGLISYSVSQIGSFLQHNGHP